MHAWHARLAEQQETRSAEAHTLPRSSTVGPSICCSRPSAADSSEVFPLPAAAHTACQPCCIKASGHQAEHPRIQAPSAHAGPAAALAWALTDRDDLKQHMQPHGGQDTPVVPTTATREPTGTLKSRSVRLGSPPSSQEKLPWTLIASCPAVHPECELASLAVQPMCEPARLIWAL